MVPDLGKRRSGSPVENAHGRPRKPLWPPGHRGFESHTFRTFHTFRTTPSAPHLPLPHLPLPHLPLCASDEGTSNPRCSASASSSWHRSWTSARAASGWPRANASVWAGRLGQPGHRHRCAWLVRAEGASPDQWVRNEAPTRQVTHGASHRRCPQPRKSRAEVTATAYYLGSSRNSSRWPMLPPLLSS
jgi:hypothetical protein